MRVVYVAVYHPRFVIQAAGVIRRRPFIPVLAGHRFATVRFAFLFHKISFASYFVSN